MEDENDNPPQFSQSHFTASLQENSDPNSLLASVTATDPDLGDNSLLRYSLRGEDAGSFLIDGETGEVRTRWSLDREEQEEDTSLTALVWMNTKLGCLFWNVGWRFSLTFAK